MSVTLAETAEDVSQIAFGFMASKALFAGLHIDVFTRLTDSPKSAAAIARETGVPANRVTTLLTALPSIGLVDRNDETYSNAPAAEQFLSRESKYEFGDNLRYQIGPGRTLARLVNLSEARSLLDVGGGTGAMSIRLLQAYSELVSTIIDFPNVSEIGWRFVTEAGMVDRIRYIPGNALQAEWPKEQDAILMSYLFSGIPGSEVPRLIEYAFDCLAAGGHMMVHDFMVEGDRTGPPMAALWQLQHMAFTPDARSVTPGWLQPKLEETGFTDIREEEMVPGMTRLIAARKPA